jgi:anti-sigma factor RsiW
MAELTGHVADETLFLWVAGELDGPASCELEEHLHSCPQCARRLELEAQLEVAMHQVGAEGASRPRHVTGPHWLERLRSVSQVRLAVAAASVVLVLVLGALGARSLSGTRPFSPMSPNPDQSHWPFALDERASKDVYGYGEELGVTVQTRNEATFRFDSAESPVAYEVIFEPRGVERRRQVGIRLNGVELGFVAPGPAAKVQRFRLPKEVLRKGGNELVFDSWDNPPGNVPWAVANVRLGISEY